MNDPLEPMGCTRFVSREKLRASKSLRNELAITCENEVVTVEVVPCEGHTIFS